MKKHTHMLQNGQRLIKIIVCVFAVLSLLCACSAEWWVGDGRGDWVTNIYKDYYIIKVNSNEICLIQKESPDASNGSFVIKCFFVVGYQIHEPYICVKGIKTQDLIASDSELENGARCYYLVNTNDEKVEGPFDTHENFMNYCNSIDLTIEPQWVKPSEHTKESS